MRLSGMIPERRPVALGDVKATDELRDTAYTTLHAVHDGQN